MCTAYREVAVRKTPHRSSLGARGRATTSASSWSCRSTSPWRSWIGG